jgi:hypothetical protein
MKSNTSQDDFIEVIKSRNNSDIVIFPSISSSSRNDCTQFYLKPVIRLRFEDISDAILNHLGACDCKGTTWTSRGWDDRHRYIHGMATGYYILQMRYQCNSCKSSKNAIEFLRPTNNKCSPIIHTMYPIKWAGEILYHEELANLIICDSMTAKTFDEISHTIRQLRFDRYTKQRARYYCAIAFNDQVTNLGCRNYFIRDNVTISGSAEFSSFDDPTGYNESPGPDPKQLISFFQGYISERKSTFEDYRRNTLPHPVMSFDTTFWAGQRTKVFLQKLQRNFF